MEILWIDCRKVSVTRAILVSSDAAISCSLVNGMNYLEGGVPNFHDDDPVLIGKGVKDVVQEKVDFDGVP